MRVSRILESQALLPPGAADNDAPPFLNMVLRGETHFTPADLLFEIKEIERELGRQDRGRWAPREIDIDILAMDDLSVREEGLIIPHPEMLNRDFVMIPLNDVAPEWRYPGAGEFFGKLPSEIITTRGYEMSAGLRETELAFT